MPGTRRSVSSFNTKCAACHIQSQSGGLSLKTYADALKGGADGPAIVPNDPDKSVLVKIQSAGGHPGQLTADELATVVAWVKAGAIEQPGAVASSPAATTEGWIGGIDQIITAKCAACHIQSQSGGLSLKTYADALKGGADGPAIVPNDPDKSVLVKIQSAGGHPGQLTAEGVGDSCRVDQSGRARTERRDFVACANASRGRACQVE